MWPFKHKHRPDYSKSKSKLACSLITGVPIQVSYQEWCKCGEQIKKELSGAGIQQFSWGADYESLFDDGPIRVASGKEEQIKEMQDQFNEAHGFKTV